MIVSVTLYLPIVKNVTLNFFHLVCTKWNLFIIRNSLIPGHLVFFIREMPIEGFFSLLYWVIFLSFIHGHYSYIWDPNPL